MATIEERLSLLEHEHARLKSDNVELKKTIELQTIAIGALVNKATLERLNEKYDKLFDTLMSHDRFTSEQLAELRGHYTELDGKVVGLQVEMRQRFDALEQSVDARFDAVNARFEGVNARFDAVNARFDALEQSVDARFDALEQSVDARFDRVDARFDRLEGLITQIIERLPR